MKIGIQRRPLVAVTLFVMLTSLVTGCSTVRKHPNFNKRSAEIQRVSVVSPEVSIQWVVFKGDNKPLFDESREASKTAFSALQEQFEKRGYEVSPLVITKDRLQKNPELERELGRLKEKYAALVKDVHEQYVKKGKWDNFKLSLGSDVNQFADLMGADALVFATGSGFTKSGGEITKDVAKSVLIAAATLGSLVVVYYTASSQVDISVVDADNGDILWHNFSDPQRGYNLTKAKDVSGAVKQILGQYPKRMAYTQAPLREPSPVMIEEEVGGRRAKINVPVEAVKLTVKTGEIAVKSAAEISTAAPRALSKAVQKEETQPKVKVPKAPPLDPAAGRKPDPAGAGLVEGGLGDSGHQKVFELGDKAIAWKGRFHGTGKSKNQPSREIRVEWYTPDLTLYKKENCKLSLASSELGARSELHLDPALGDWLVGQWRVLVWEKDKLIDDRSFRVVKSKSGVRP